MLRFVSCCDDVVKFKTSLLSFQLKTKLESKTARFKNTFANLFFCISLYYSHRTNCYQLLRKGNEFSPLTGIS